MTDDFSEISTKTDGSKDYAHEEMSKTEVKKESEGSVFKEPDYEDKSPTSFKESLKLYGTIKKPRIRTCIVKKVG